ncbi:MAG: hypothetical protein M1821_001292 [Bathelium mastoideum]|nr:MAG: hypothetical protein M1821_001292 [Bathelium mastoideum]
MSLFANLGQNNPASAGPTSTNASQPQQSTGLFANLGASQSPAGSTVFGTSQPQSNSGGSLFDRITSSQPQQSGGLFGSTSTSQPQQSQPTSSTSLFGNQGNNQTAKSSGNPFGSLGPTSQPATQTSNAGSLFGGANTAQAQQSQSGNTGSLFGGSTATGNTQAQTQQQSTQGPQNTAPPSQPAYFDHLLERGKKRATQDNGAGSLADLPSLQLGLGDIARKVRNLGNGSPSVHQARATDNSRAHYLLAASGVSTGSALRDLNNFSAQAAAAAAATPPPDTNIENYVKELQTKSTLDLIAEGLEDSRRDFDAFLEENVQMEWDTQRRRIYEHLGLAKPSDKDGDNTAGAPNQSFRETGAFGRSSRKSRGFGASAQTSFGKSSMTRSILGPSGANGDGRTIVFTDVAEKVSSAPGLSAPDARFDRERQERYADKVRELNVARLEEVVYPVVQRFAEVEAQVPSDNASKLVKAYEAIGEVVQENANVQRPSDPGAIKERQYAAQYLEESHASTLSITIRRRILDGSRRFLEKKFWNELEAAIARNPREANLGGVPSTLNKVRAYVRLRASHKELGPENVELQMIQEDYCWVIIWYLLRCGFVQEAAQYVSDNERAIKSMDRSFPQYMSSYAKDPNRRLVPELQTRITAEYQQRVRAAPENSLDPYRMACLKLLGRCDLTRRSIEGINQDLDTWTWLQISMAREVNRVEENAGEVFGLQELRDSFRDLGQRHFSAPDSLETVMTYFTLQILAGMYEQAISFLYGYNYIAAVHFAIALDFYGLLRVSNHFTTPELLSFTTRGQPQINFGLMLGSYTRDFRTGKAVVAADYLILICLNADLTGQLGDAQVRLCHEALRELVLETRDYAELLGDVRSDGQRIKGAIEQRLKLIRLNDQDSYLKLVTIQAASVAEDSGRTTDAVLLYHLAEEYEKVTDLANRALSESISIDIGQEPLRLEPLRPRIQQQGRPNGQLNHQGNSPLQPPGDSLSLAVVDDPAELARQMQATYSRNALILKKISSSKREACAMLLRMQEAKKLIEGAQWALAVDKIKTLNLIPIDTYGNVQVIRERSQTFHTLEPVISRNIGHLLLWTIRASGCQRDIVANSAYDTNERQQVIDRCTWNAKDSMVFAGLVRYRMPSRLFDDLARAGQEVGV